MKKTLFGFVMMMALLTTSCASLRIDKVESDGSRFLSTKDSRLYTGFSTGGSFALTCHMTKDGVATYSLRVVMNEGHVRISEGRKLMLKTDSGEIIELKNLIYVGPGSYEDVYPNYGMTEEQINQIIKGNIVKIRIETDGEMIDHNLNGNQLSLGLKEKYEEIKSALKERKTVSLLRFLRVGLACLINNGKKSRSSQEERPWVSEWFSYLVTQSLCHLVRHRFWLCRPRHP